VDDAAIAHEQAALFDGDDFAEWRDPVLQRHARSLTNALRGRAFGFMLRAMAKRGVLGRIALAFGALLPISADARHFIDPVPIRAARACER
jgi:hypothetical protein